MDIEGKESVATAESDLLWPSHDVEDPSRTFLNSERAKYHEKPQFALLFTWKGRNNSFFIDMHYDSVANVKLKLPFAK